MMKVFTIAAVLALCVCFAAAQTPAATQPSASTQSQPQITNGLKLEFANANSAKIAWTSKQGADMDLHYSTDRNNLQQAAVGAVEKMSGENHRATLAGLQPNTTYYVATTTKDGQVVGPVYSFKTPDHGQPAIHEQALTPIQ